MNRSWLLSLLLLSVLHLSLATPNSLTISTDQGETWSPLSLPLPQPSLPAHVHLRHSSGPSAPTLHAPRCAVGGALRLSLVRDSYGKALGLRWAAAKACDGQWSAGSGPDLAVTEEVAKRIRPDWADYLSKSAPDGGEKATEEEVVDTRKEKGFFGKYGLYIMGFVVYALARGIQTGFAQLKEEAESEEQEKLKERKPKGQVRVVVPKRRQSTKSQRKAKSAQRARTSRKQ